MYDTKAIGQRIKSWCIDAGLTQEQAADLLHMTYAKFKALVNAQSAITFDDAYAICEAFGKPLDELARRGE